MRIEITSQITTEIAYERLFSVCGDAITMLFPQYLLHSREVSIVLVDRITIRSLNQTHRNKNSETDVLSFPLSTVNDSKDYPLGEIFICQEYAQDRADQLNHSLMHEMSILCIHGLLHLVGFDHIKDHEYEVMHQYEEQALHYVLENFSMSDII